ncbi:MAG: hypothetical protein JW924_03380 [Fusobacteriaceae bacterium]|nr:hypothetical protein [Fusobacteriaceae bacterium]
MLDKLKNQNLHLEISRLIGQPISLELSAPMALQAIADIELVPAGEKVYAFQSYDDEKGEVLQINPSTCKIIPVKRSPVGDTEVTLTGFQSKLEWICVDDILDASDQTLFARKKEIITNNLDKKEVKMVLDGIVNASSGSFVDANVQAITKDSGEDLYDVVQKAIHALEDYGDGFVLLAGTAVKEKIDLYDKEKASTHNYRVGLNEFLRTKGVNVIKVFGTVVETDGGSANRLLDAESFILVATNSTVASGKPIKFARRQINAELASLMGAKVDEAQRATLALPTPIIDSGENKLAYGTYAYEKIAVVITNPRMIAVALDVV